MVLIKANKAEGSFLGLGTHVWLEIIDQHGVRTTFSGSRGGKFLHVLKNYKRDMERESERGLIEIVPPQGMSEEVWDGKVIAAATDVLIQMHKLYGFNGFWPWGKTRAGLPRSNCCRVVKKIIDQAGETIPDGKIKGVLPGLGRGWRDYL